MADLGITNVLDVEGNAAQDDVDSGNPVKIGGYAKASAPSNVSADGDRVNAWFSQFGALNVILRDTSGTAIATGTQYAEDAALGAVGAGIGTLLIGRAAAAAPTSVSADADAVGLWASRFGALNIIPRDTAGAALMTAAAAMADAFANPTVGAGAVAGLVFNGTTWDRMRSVQSLDAAPNADTGILAAGMGPGFDRKANPAGVAATSTANAVTVTVDGADMVVFEVTTIGTTPGSMIFEEEADDATWATAGMVVKLASGPDVRIEGAFVPAVGDIYFVRTTGYRRVRYRVNAVYASGTATVKVTSSTGVAMVKSIDMGGPPHNFGYPLASATAQYTSNQTSTTLGPTVASTQRMVVTSIQIQVGGTTAGTAQVYFGTGAYSRGTNKAIFDGEFAPSATSKPGFALAPAVPWVGAADEELKVTTAGTGLNPITVTVWYYLVAA